METGSVALSEAEREFLIHVLRSARAAVARERNATGETAGNDTKEAGAEPAPSALFEDSHCLALMNSSIDMAEELLRKTEPAPEETAVELPETICNIIETNLLWYARSSLDGEIIQRYVDDMVSDMSSCSPVMSTDLEIWRQDGTSLRKENKATALNLRDRFKDC